MDKKVTKTKTVSLKKKDYSGKEVMAKIMASLQKVDPEGTDAKINEYSMDDNNGNRVIYFIVDGNKYIFNGNRKKTLELLRLLEGSLTLVSWGEETSKSRKRLGFKTKSPKLG
jgi:hypothetical protein